LVRKCTNRGNFGILNSDQALSQLLSHVRHRQPFVARCNLKSRSLSPIPLALGRFREAKYLTAGLFRQCKDHSPKVRPLFKLVLNLSFAPSPLKDRVVVLKSQKKLDCANLRVSDPEVGWYPCLNP